MDQNWAQKEAVAAAVAKVREAEVLLREARDIFKATDRQVNHLNLGEALEYTGEVA